MLPRHAKADVDFSYFYDNLSPYGEWVDVSPYGYCWRPTVTDPNWRPYTDGYWAFTDAGWTWVSYEDFGAITYHYGRWVRLEDAGWIWHPGYEWGPAWVSWRKSDTYVGWAPLPPECEFRHGVGVSIWVDRDFNIGPGFYSFCEFRHFGAPVMRSVIIAPEQNVTIISRTTNITNITYNNNSTVVYNGGPDYRAVARMSERPVQTLRLERRAVVPAQGGGVRPAQVVGNQLVVNAPVVAKPTTPFVPPKVARVISQPKVDNGWAAVKDPAVKQQLRQQIAEQTKGVTAQNAPAKTVDPRSLRGVLPPTSDPHGNPAGIRNPGTVSKIQPGSQPGQAIQVQPTPPLIHGKSNSHLQPFAPGSQSPEQGQPVQQPMPPSQAGQTLQSTAPSIHGAGKQKLQPLTSEAQPGPTTPPVRANAPMATPKEHRPQPPQPEALAPQVPKQQQAEHAAQIQQQRHAAQAVQVQQQQSQHAAQVQQQHQKESASQVQAQRQLQHSAQPSASQKGEDKKKKKKDDENP